MAYSFVAPYTTLYILIRLIFYFSRHGIAVLWVGSIQEHRQYASYLKKMRIIRSVRTALSRFNRRESYPFAGRSRGTEGRSGGEK